MYNMGEPGETASIHVRDANHSLPYVRNYLRFYLMADVEQRMNALLDA